MLHLWNLIRRFDYVLLFVVLIVCSILLMVQNSYYQRSMVLKLAAGISGSWYSNVSAIDEYFKLKEENEKLSRENAYLRAHMAESYISYTDSVFRVSDTVYSQCYAYTEAKVIKSSWSQLNNYIMINKGSAQGIEPDMAVTSPQGIVGIVVNCTKNFATIMPVLHSSSQNSVRVKRIGTNGTLTWDGRDFRYASVIDIPTTHKLYKNDTIVTSGMSNEFPEGIPVGVVTSLESDDNNGFYRIRIKLSTDFNKLGYVYVIQNRFKDEQDALYNSITEQ